MKKLLFWVSAVLIFVFWPVSFFLANNNAWPQFFVGTQSIFTPDPLAADIQSTKISLIPNRNLARIYENKTTIPLDKFKSNIFVSLDLNNYFFSLHPQEISGGLNLTKYPYLAIIPFLVGLYFISENKQRKWIICYFIIVVLSLAFINRQDRFDILLYFPISMICLHGLKKIYNTSSAIFYFFSSVFIPISLIEFLRIIFAK